MPTNRRRRLQELREPLTNAMKAFLLSGSYERAADARSPGARGFSEGLALVLIGTPDQHRRLWQAHRDELLEAARPGLPWAWQQFENGDASRPDPTDDDHDDEDAELV